MHRSTLTLLILGLLLAACGTLEIRFDQSAELGSASGNLASAPDDEVNEEKPGDAGTALDNHDGGNASPVLEAPFETENLECAADFDGHPIPDLYRVEGDPIRHAYSEQEFYEALAQMGIQDICLPGELGAPFEIVDWNENEMPATQGRMLVIGFDGMLNGGRWSDGFLVYSTYDFLVGTEYEIFATDEDRTALNSGSIGDPIVVGGAVGFKRVLPSAYSFGTRSIYLSYVFPFEDSYVAVVYLIGDAEISDIENTSIATILEEISDEDDQRNGAVMEFLANSLDFSP